VQTNGRGRTGLLQNSNNVNAGDVFSVLTNGTGRTAFFSSANSANAVNVIDVSSNGLGTLGYWRSTNPANVNDVFDVHSNGMGNVGVFHNLNPSNNNNALNIYTNGPGYAAFIQSTNALHRGLHVDGSLRIDGPQIFNGPQFISDATESVSTTTGALVVAGGVGIGKNLNVGGIERIWNTTESTNVTDGALTIDGGVGISKKLNVGGDTKMYGRATVHGITSLFGPTFMFKSMMLRDTVSGYEVATFINHASDGNGIGIQVGNSTPNNNNNFITFRNANFETIGRIEGQTNSELINSFMYQWETTLASFKTGYYTGMIIADFAGFDDPDAAIVETVMSVLEAGHTVAKQIQLQFNVGITYESGSGDYAEWLKKSIVEEKYSFGDIVSVNGGVISKHTSFGNQYMVVSLAPIVLGNMPEKGKESSYEKVAFMGQVPVKVRGLVNKGDIIIPSGLNDGTGIALPRTKLTGEQYKQIIGIAWSSGYSSSGFTLINTIVGVSANIMAEKIAEQDNELNSVKRELSRITSYLNSKDPSFSNYTDSNKKTDPRTETEDLGRKPNNLVNFTDFNIEKIKAKLQENKQAVAKILATLKAVLDNRQVQYENFPKLKRLVTDVDFFIESVGKDESYFR
jgi:hypothetical protein